MAVPITPDASVAVMVWPPCSKDGATTTAVKPPNGSTVASATGVPSNVNSTLEPGEKPAPFTMVTKLELGISYISPTVGTTAGTFASVGIGSLKVRFSVYTLKSPSNRRVSTALIRPNSFTR